MGRERERQTDRQTDTEDVSEPATLDSSKKRQSKIKHHISPEIDDKK